jgi:phosphopantetheinyl transferase
MRIAGCALNGRSGHEAGRELLATLYRQETGQTLPQILKTKRGKPYFADSSFHFSISHTPHHAFCVLSGCNVGLDAEELDREINLKLAQKILSPSEYGQYERAPDQRLALLRFWVMKEAQAKLTGEGIKFHPNHTEFMLTDPRVRELHGCLVAVFEEEDHVI